MARAYGGLPASLYSSVVITVQGMMSLREQLLHRLINYDTLFSSITVLVWTSTRFLKIMTLLSCINHVRIALHPYPSRGCHSPTPRRNVPFDPVQSQ
jgi:hypothetical protein